MIHSDRNIPNHPTAHGKIEHSAFGALHTVTAPHKSDFRFRTENKVRETFTSPNDNTALNIIKSRKRRSGANCNVHQSPRHLCVPAKFPISRKEITRNFQRFSAVSGQLEFPRVRGNSIAAVVRFRASVPSPVVTI